MEILAALTQHCLVLLLASPTVAARIVVVLVISESWLVIYITAYMVVVLNTSWWWCWWCHDLLSGGSGGQCGVGRYMVQDSKTAPANWRLKLIAMKQNGVITTPSISGGNHAAPNQCRNLC